ncbi:MAG TPA: FAD-binding oxidoreductase [Candidatus Polarisedimenticolaceae bacterium]|nr:FAD-binding oxidoreductase [Candidatus Polarisedimenticolaceae bacterium]
MSFLQRIEGLRGRMQGALIGPGDADFDQARRVWNGMIDRRPALIARCGSTDDVVAAIAFARDNGLALAVRGGGHNVSGNATCDAGIVADLGPMNTVRVDSGGRTASAGGGTRWAEYDRETQRHALASPGGAISTTGVAGLTLGGGFGWLSRSWGLACDNLLSAEVVTAAGEVLTASADENREMFWGLRGGGGNFGAVTRLDFRLRPLERLHAGLLLYPRARGREFLQAYREMTAEAPDALSSMAAFLHTPDGVPVVGAFVVYLGEAGPGNRAIAPLRALGPPLLDDVGPKAYTAVQQAFDAGFPAGKRNYWKSTFLSRLGDEALDVLVDHAERAPTLTSIVALEHMLGGAVARVGAEETAFGHRGATYNLLVLGMGEAAAGDGDLRAWTRGLWRAMQPYSSGAVYVNYMDADEEDRIGEAYGSTNYRRLVALKDRYDPDNLFRLNQNIAPSRAAPR